MLELLESAQFKALDGIENGKLIKKNERTFNETLATLFGSHLYFLCLYFIHGRL
jgi:hypothetical protein